MQRDFLFITIFRDKQTLQPKQLRNFFAFLFTLLKPKMKKKIEIIEQDLHNTKELGDSADEGTAFDGLGLAYYQLGDFKQATKYHKQYLSIAKGLKDKADEYCACHSLGSAYEKLGDFNQAIEYHKQLLSIAGELRDKACEGHAYKHLASAYKELGDFNQAR